MRVQEDLLTSPMYQRRKGFTAPSSRRVSEQLPTNSLGSYELQESGFRDDDLIEDDNVTLINYLAR